MKKMLITQYSITQYNADNVCLSASGAVTIRGDFRDTKLRLGTSHGEFAVDVAMWECRSHYVIAMSWGGKGRKRG